MKLNFFKRFSSKLYTIVPMIILMGATQECTESFMKDLFSPPKNPFAQTNSGRHVVAYRIGEIECVFYNEMLTPGAYVDCYLYQKDNLNEFKIHTSSLDLYVYSDEMIKIQEKYSVGDTLAVTGKPMFFVNKYQFKSISGWLEFRYFQDRIAAGNFEAVLVRIKEPYDTLKITDGTFDVKCGFLGAKN